MRSPGTSGTIGEPLRAEAVRSHQAWRAPTGLANSVPIVHARGMSVAHAHDPTVIPSAPVDDLDLDRDEDEEEWERRVMQLAAGRIQAVRARLEALGVVDATGGLVSRSLPPDMASDSDTTLETG
jgi:hypothetical protein